MPRTAPLLNLSAERRETALSWIRGEMLDADLSEDAEVMAAMGLLVCDDDGHVKQADLMVALADPSAVQIARELLREARG